MKVLVSVNIYSPLILTFEVLAAPAGPNVATKCAEGMPVCSGEPYKVYYRLPMQRPASDGNAALAGDRRRPNWERGKTFSPATSALHLRGGLTLVVFSACRPHAAATWAGGLLAL